MSWAKLDDQFPHHPKMAKAGGDAGWLFVCALCYCASHLTDGRFPKAIVPQLSDRKNPNGLARRLVEVGAWVEHEDDYEIHDYLEWNPSREHVQEERRRARERRTKGGQRSADVRANGARDNPGPSPSPSTGSNEPVGAAQAASPNGESKKGTRIPDVFTVTDEMSEWALTTCPLVNVERSTIKFVNHWKAKTGKDATKRDWKRTWQNWLISDQEDQERRERPRTASTRRSNGWQPR